MSELRNFIQQSNDLKSISFKERKPILNTLLELVTSERSVYIQSIRKKENNEASEKRLLEASDLVRKVIFSSLDEMKTTTCKITLYHIADTLLSPTTDDLFCMPLLDSYSKIFKSIVELPRYVEHLRVSEIKHLINFLMKAIDAMSILLGTTESESASTSSMGGLSGVSTWRNLHYAASEFFHSIFSLLKYGFDVEHNQVVDLWDVISKFMKTVKDLSACDLQLLLIANWILKTFSTSDFDFCENVASSVFLLMPQLTLSKQHLVKDNTLIFLQYAFPFLKKIFTNLEEHNDSYVTDLSSCIDSLKENFSSRNNVLSTDDIDINQSLNSTPCSFNQKFFHLRINRNTSVWVSSLFYYHVNYLYYIKTRFLASRRTKRPRRTLTHIDSTKDEMSISDHIGEEIATSLDTSNTTLIADLQSFIFYFEENGLSSSLIGSTFDSLAKLTNNSDTQVSAWSLLCLCYLLTEFNDYPFDESTLENLWNMTCKRFYNPKFSTIACFFLYTILYQKMFSANIRISKIERLMAMFDSSGPILSNGAIHLANYLLQIYSTSLVNKAPQSLEKLSFWFRSQWTVDVLSEKLDNVQSILPGTASNFLLSMLGVEYNYTKSFIYSGSFSEAFLDINIRGTAQKYLDTCAIEDSPATKPKLNITRYTPSREQVFNMLNEWTEACDRIIIDLQEPVSRFSSAPELYEKILNYFNTLLLVSCKLETAVPDYQSQCRALALKAQFLILEVVNIAKKTVIHDINVPNYILQGLEMLTEVYSEMTDPFYVEICRQYLTEFLDILNGKVEISSGFHDDDTEEQRLVKLPNPLHAHHLHTLQTSRDFQMYRVFASVKLLTIYFQSGNSIYESFQQLLFDSIDGNEVVFQYLVLMNFIPSSQTTSVALESILVNLVRLHGDYGMNLYEFGRSETMVLYSIKLLDDFCKTWTNSENTDLLKMCNQLLAWVCNQHIEEGRVNSVTQGKLVKLLVKTFKLNPSIMISENMDLISCFCKISTNSFNVIYEVAPKFPQYFAIFSAEYVLEIYLLLISSMPVVSNEIESLAVRCFLTTYLAISSSSLAISSVSDLLLLDHYNYVQPCLQISIETISEHYNEPNVQSFFKRQCEELLILWYMKNPRTKFPYHYFGYSSEAEFIKCNYGFLSVIQMFILEKSSLPVIKELASIAGVSDDELINTCAPRAWVYNITSGNTEYTFEYWLSQVVGKDIWRNICKQQLPVIISSLVLLTDFSEVNSSSTNSKLLSDIHSRFSSKKYSNMKQHLISSSQLVVLVRKIMLDVGKGSWDVPATMTYALRRIVNKIANSIDPNQKGINFRRLLFLADIFSSTIFEQEYLRIIFGAAASLLKVPLLQEEVLVVFKVLMTKLQHHSHDESQEYLLKYILILVENLFIQRYENDNPTNIDLNWLKTWSKSSLIPSFYHPVFQVIISWLNYEQKSIEDKHFISMIRMCSKGNLQRFINIVSVEMDTNVRLQDSLLANVDKSWESFLALLLGLDTIQSRAYTMWLARTVGKFYSLTGQILPRDEYLEDQPAHKNPLRNIFTILKSFLQSDDIMIVSYAEEAVRHIRTYISAPSKNELLSVFQPSELKIYDYESRITPLQLEDFGIDKLSEYTHNLEEWVFKVCSTLLAHAAKEYPELHGLQQLLTNVPQAGTKILDYAFHLYLTTLKGVTDSNLNTELNKAMTKRNDIAELIIKVTLFLRKIGYSKQYNSTYYINLDLKIAVKSCISSKKFQSALMLAEVDWSHATLNDENFELYDQLSQIYENLEDPDVFYAVPVETSMNGLIKTFQFEKRDSQLLICESSLMNENFINKSPQNGLNMVNTLNNTGMLGMSKFVLDSLNMTESNAFYSQAWKLQQWDIAYAPDPKTSDEIIFNLYKSLYTQSDVRESVYKGYLSALNLVKKSKGPLYSSLFQTMAIVEECESTLDTVEDESLMAELKNEQKQRSLPWMVYASFEKIEDILFARTLNWKSVNLYNGSDKNTRIAEIEGENLQHFSEVARKHKAVQHSINAVVRLEGIVKKFQAQNDGSSDIKVTLERLNYWYKVETAASAWILGQQKFAITTLKSLIVDENSSNWLEDKIPLLNSMLVSNHFLSS